FDATRATLSPGATAPGLAGPRTTDLPVTDWRESRTPKLGSELLKLDQHETSHSVAFAPDGTRLVLGGLWSLLAFDARGQQIWRSQVPGVVWGVNVTGDGRMVVIALGDGTIRWRRMSDGQELLALFVHTEDQRWVAWTPSGYYMASPGGEDLIGWHVNRGWDQQADFFPVSRFRDRFNRPDIVRLVLETLDEGAAVKQANSASGKKEALQPLAAKLPPVVTIVAPATGSHFSGGDVTIEYTVRSPSGQAIDRVDTLVDGRAVQSRGLERVSTGDAAGKRSLTLPLPSHDVEIGLF